jgi:hypothetical protein
LRVVADSHALVWFTQGSSRLSTTAAEVLHAAEASQGVVVSVATLIDLWYVTQTTQGVSVTQLVDLRRLVAGTPAVSFYSVDTDRTRPASPRLRSWVKGLSVAGWRSHPDGCLTLLR